MEERQYLELLTLGPASNELEGKPSKRLWGTKPSTRLEDNNRKWNINKNKFIVVVKIVCSLLEMFEIAKTSNSYVKSTAFQRICELIICVFIVWLTTVRLSIQGNMTTDFCSTQFEKPYSFKLSQAIANSRSAIARNIPLCFYSLNCMTGSGSDALYASESKHESICFTLCYFVQVEVVSENADSKLNKTTFGLSIGIAYRFCYRHKWYPTHYCTSITTSEEVLVYCFHTSCKFQADVKSDTAVNTILRSKTYGSLDTFAADDMINKTKFKSNYFDTQNDVKCNCSQNLCHVDYSFAMSVSKEMIHAPFSRKKTFWPETLTTPISKRNIGISLSTLLESKYILNSVIKHRNGTILCLQSSQANERIMWLKTSDENETMNVKSLDVIGNFPVGHNRQPNKLTIRNETNAVPTPNVQRNTLSDLQDLIHNLKRLYSVTSKPCNSIRVGAIKAQNDETIKMSTLPQIHEHKGTLQKKHATKEVELNSDGKWKKTWKIVLKDISSVSVSAPRICIVAPVTRNEHCGAKPQVDVLRKLDDVVERTLKRESVPAQESMVFELLRICTFRTFPKNDKPDVGAFAAAGFYYASQNDEVICYCCYKRISNWSKSDDPSAVHVRISPQCKFNTSNSEVNVSKAVTKSVQSDILAKLQGNKSSSNATNSHNTASSMSMVPSRVIDGKRSIATGQHYESRVSMNTSQKTHTNHAFSADSLPPTSRTPNTTTGPFQSLIPQTFSNNTASSKTSRFQTGKFVSSVNFAIPDSNTKAIQPVDDAIEPGIKIDDYMEEYNSGSNGGNKSTSKASTQTIDTGLNGIVESLITSEASVIVQGMGYSSSLMKQALSRLVNKGKTKLGPQDIMQEIFIIEDE